MKNVNLSIWRNLSRMIDIRKNQILARWYFKVGKV